MSGLSLEDMRRIGAQRNQTITTDKPAKTGLLSRLPFSRSDAPADDTAGAAEHPPARERVDSVRRTVEAAAPVAPLGTNTAPQLEDSQANAQLRQSVLRHTAAGGALGAVVGLVATGAPLALTGGAAFGALSGYAVGKRAVALPADKAKAVELKAKQAERLFAAVKSACGLVECAEGKLKIMIDQTVGVRAQAIGGGRRSSPKGYTVSIGLAVLSGLRLNDIEALAAHALACAQIEAQDSHVRPETAERLSVLASSLGKRTPALRLTNLDTLESKAEDAGKAFEAGWEASAREADRLAGRYAGQRALTEALLAQALLAARFTEELASGASYAEALGTLRSGYGRADLDTALHRVAQITKPSPDLARMGLPILLLDRMTRLDTACSVPTLPALAPALGDLSDAVINRLEKQLAPAFKQKKAKAASKPAKAKPNHSAKTSETEARRSTKPEKAAGKSGLLGGLFRRKKDAKAHLGDLAPASQPLYQADALFKNDPGLGLEAYAALVEAHPRWMLARLRLAEAQIECGNPECVSNLMACAESLPSALPTILDRLQSALAMVSPLDGEPLRQMIEGMKHSAPAIARERAEIELEGLTTCTLDAQDQEALNALFNSSPSLREVWVLTAPCSYMPEVAHHAILGLAPRLSPEDAYALALTLAEHAAIRGTVAVHIETGTPRGALGDTLASYSSLWRAHSG